MILISHGSTLNGLALVLEKETLSPGACMQSHPIVSVSYHIHVLTNTFSRNWVFIACSVYTSSSCTGDTTGCDPSCCNKGSCGLSSSTNLLLSPSPSSPYYTISALAPSTAFTLFDVTFTTGYFLPQYPSVTIEITGTRADGTVLAPQSFIINKPYGTFYTTVAKNLVQMGLGNVKELRFLAYYTGTWGAGGQGPDGRVLAESRLDGDGSGGPIRYEAYTPRCRRGYRRRAEVEERDGGKSNIVIGSKNGENGWN